MLLYILLAFLLLIFSNSKDRVVFLFFSFFILLLGAVRDYSVGTDTINYYYYYKDSLVGYDDSSRVELLYQLLVSFAKGQNFSYRFIICVEITLFVICSSFVVYNTCKKTVLGLLLLFLLGFYFNAFNISRQMIACGFAFLGYYFLNEKKWGLYIAATLIACLFHSSAIVVLFVIILALSKIKTRPLIVTIIIIISFVLPYLIDLSGLVSVLLGYFPSFNQYKYYVEYLDFSGPRGFQTFTLLTNMVFIYLLLRVKIEWDLFAKVALFGLVFSNLFIFAPGYLSRLFIYFNIAQVPFFIKVMSKRLSTSIIIVSYSFVYFFYYTYYYGLDGVLPYIIM